MNFEGQDNVTNIKPLISLEFQIMLNDFKTVTPSEMNKSGSLRFMTVF